MRTQARMRYSGTFHTRVAFAYRALTFYDAVFQRTSTMQHALKEKPEHHISTQLAQGDSVCSLPSSFALLTEFLLVSFPRRTKIFQFCRSSPLPGQFGNPWFKGCLRLPTAFRSLLRPSSSLKPNHPLNGSSNNYWKLTIW